MELRSVENELRGMASRYESLWKRTGGTIDPDDEKQTNDAGEGMAVLADGDNPSLSLSSSSGHLPSLESIVYYREQKIMQEGNRGDRDGDTTSASDLANSDGNGEKFRAGKQRREEDDDIVIVEHEDSAEEKETPVSPREALAALESLKQGMDALHVKMERFRKRMNEKDPVTGNPRYGEKTTGRVTKMIDLYDCLNDAIAIAFGEDGVEKTSLNGKPTPSNSGGGIVEAWRLAVQKEEEAQRLAEQTAAERTKFEEAAKREEEVRMAELRAREEEEAVAARRREEAELARRAEEARRARIEAERRAEEEAREAERVWVDSIPKGPDGVRQQLKAIRDGCTAASDPKGRSTAIQALHTIFSQIVAHPEDVKFRRIRRDHPRFHEDVGRHPGGKELLIAAGFRPDIVDGVPSFFSREPDIENDMDGWSSWFDLLKTTLEILEEEMING